MLSEMEKVPQGWQEKHRWVLVVDNWLALNVLLPRAFSGSPLVRQRDLPGLAFFTLLSTWHFGVGPAIREAVLAARGG